MFLSCFVSLLVCLSECLCKNACIGSRETFGSVNFGQWNSRILRHFWWRLHVCSEIDCCGKFCCYITCTESGEIRNGNSILLLYCCLSALVVDVAVYCSVFLKSLKYFAKTIRDKFTADFHFEVISLLLILNIITLHLYTGHSKKWLDKYLTTTSMFFL